MALSIHRRVTLNRRFHPTQIGDRKRVRYVREVGVETFCGRGVYVCVDIDESNGEPVWCSLEHSKWAQQVAAAHPKVEE
jgi:hypothetical protein